MDTSGDFNLAIDTPFRVPHQLHQVGLAQRGGRSRVGAVTTRTSRAVRVVRSGKAARAARKYSRS